MTAADLEGRFPEHEKLGEVKDASQQLGFLIERLQSHGIVFARWQDSSERRGYRTVCDGCGQEREHGEERLVPFRGGIQELLALLYEIDYTRLMAEKDELYAMLVARSEAPS